MRLQQASSYFVVYLSRRKWDRNYCEALVGFFFFYFSLDGFKTSKILNFNNYFSQLQSDCFDEKNTVNKQAILILIVKNRISEKISCEESTIVFANFAYLTHIGQNHVRHEIIEF